MAFEPVYEVAVLDGLQKLCSGQVVAEAKLVPPHGEEITKILGVSAMADVVATEVFTGEARIKGRVDFRVLYTGSGGDRCLDLRAEFTDKISDDAITGGRPCVCAKVLDTDIVSASDSEIRLAAVVETELFGQVSKRIKYLVKGGDSTYLSEQKLDAAKVVCFASGKTELTAEAAINANKIECVESRIALTKTIASTNMVVFEGEIVSDVVYNGESGMGHSTLVTPFEFEAEAEGAASGNTISACARIADVKATLSDGEETSVLISYEVEASGFVWDSNTITYVADAFSVTNELNKQTENIEFICNKQCAYISDEVSGSITLEAGLPIVDNIITPLGSSVILSNVYAQDSRVVIEGLVRTTIVYFSGESNSSSAVSAELPFSISKPFDVSEGDPVYAVAEVLGVSAKIRRGNEIDVRSELKICLNIGEKKEIEVITELSEGERRIPPQGALILHIANKKETLWDVAKALCATPETVLEQNPELSFPLSGGERIICFRSKK